MRALSTLNASDPCRTQSDAPDANEQSNEQDSE